MKLPPLTREEANQLVIDALMQLIQNDSKLLDLNVCERALHFRIAHYMAQSKIITRPLTLDCEYNRHHNNPKLLQLAHRPSPSKVFPDILVHERDSDENNMLALEIKRPGQSLVKDGHKLRAFMNQLGYHHAGHIIIGHDRHDTLIHEVRWLDA